MTISRRLFLSRVAQAGGYGATFAAMQALGLLASAEASALQPMPADLGRGKKVVVLGAGIAGLTSAYELRKIGFDVTVLEARDRPGGRNWSVRAGTRVELTDGSVQNCDWDEGTYLNAGPARIPSIHKNLLGYCRELGVPLEVEINVSRSALMQAPQVAGGKPVEQRQVVHDMRGHMAELLSKAISSKALDDALTPEDAERLLAFLSAYGDLSPSRTYRGTPRAGFSVARAAGTDMPTLRQPIPLHDLLAADFSKGLLYEEQIDWQATMFQPVGGMDRIPYAFADSLGAIVRYNLPVSAVKRSGNGVRIETAGKAAGAAIEADYCISTMPISIMRTMDIDLPTASKAALTGMPMAALYKIGWQSPRFWEHDNNIYGGISFLKSDVVDLVWYPSNGLFTEKGMILSGFNGEEDHRGKPTAFGMLPSVQARLDASRTAVEVLHPGRGKLLEKPIYVPWKRVPYSLGCFAINELATSQGAYNQLNTLDGPILLAGDYLSRLVGWQEGAVLSAHRAVAEIARREKPA